MLLSATLPVRSPLHIVQVPSLGSVLGVSHIGEVSETYLSMNNDSM